MNKAVFIEDSEGNTILSYPDRVLDETDGWLYGWNNALQVRVPGYIRLRTRFRDIYREESRDKRFSVYLDNVYPFTKYLKRSSFFIDQKNVAQIFQKKTDDESWGFEVDIRPHHTVEVIGRIRVRYSDKNGDGEIGGGEVERNFGGSVVVDGNYWWREFREWYKKRRESRKGDS